MLPDVLSAMLRAFGFVAILQAGGAVLFLAIFGRDVDAARSRIIRLTRISVLAGAVLLTAQYMLEPARMAGALAGVFDTELQAFALHSHAALVVAIRLTGLLLLAWAVRGDGVGVRSYGAAGAVLIALSFPMIGHSAENPARWWLAPLLALHLLVVEFWFGALLPLMLIGEREPASTVARVVEGFSRLATWLVPLILVAGLIIAAKLLPDWATLREPYGIGLILKVALFSLLMGLAAFNKWRLGPALAQGGRSARLRLRRSIATEFVLIVLVLAGTATLTTFLSPGS